MTLNRTEAHRWWHKHKLLKVQLDRVPVWGREMGVGSRP